MPNITEHHAFYGTTPSLNVDQTGTQDFISGGTYIYRSGSPLTVPCTVGVGVTMSNADLSTTGHIFSRTSSRHNIVLIAGEIRLFYDITLVYSFAPSISATDHDYWFHWSVAEDPRDSGTHWHEFRMWNVTDDELVEGVMFSTNAISLAERDIIFGANNTGGAAATTATLTTCSYLLHESPALSAYLSEVGSLTAPTISSELETPVPIPDGSSGFASQGRLSGPTHALAAASTQAFERRLLSPLVNKSWASPEQTDTFTNIQSDPWWRLSPDGQTWMSLAWLYRRKVPLTVDQVRFRIFVRSENLANSGSFNEVDIVAWSMNRPPGQLNLDNPGFEPQPLVTYSATSTVVNVNDDTPSEIGRWVEIGPINVARGEDNETSYFTLSWRAYGTSSPTAQRLEIFSFIVDPVSSGSTDADIGLGL